MSLKVKLISSISAFVLVFSLVIIGVLAATQATVNMGGSISFEATNVYARVTGSIAGAGEGNATLPTLDFSATNDSPDQSGWSNLNLKFDDNATEIVITITVENLSTARTLTVNLQDTTVGESVNLLKSMTKDGNYYSSGTNDTIDVSTGEGTSKTTYQIKFNVEDQNENVDLTDFTYTINMYDESVAPALTNYTEQGFEFTVNEEEKTATLTKYTGSATEVVIPATISKSTDGAFVEGNDYVVTQTVDNGNLTLGFFSASPKSVKIPEKMTYR